MKKLVLNLGLATLTVLPIVAVASCSATTPEAPSLTTEVAKYKNPFTAKDTAKTMTSLAAIATIKGNNTEKLTALQNLVTLQLDNTNFTYTVENAAVGANDQTIDVTMKITEKASSAKSETVKVVINGFAQATSPLDIEAKRFQTSIEANTASKALTAASVIKKINDAEAGAKLTELEKVATVPTPNNGFTIEVVSAQAGSTETSVAATIKVTQTEGGKTAEATFTVTGFSTTQSVIQAEAAKLENKTVLTGKETETAAQAGTAITAETLASYYAPVTLSDGFSYTWKSNEVIGDTVKVTVTVSSTDTSISSIEHSFIISGFKTALDAEAERFAISLPGKTALNGEITTRLVVSSINQTADTQEKKLTAINALVDNFPKIDAAYTLNIGTAALVAGTDTSVTIELVITQTSTNTKKTVTFTITGLKAETLEQEVDRLATTNLVTQPVLEGKANETAATAATAITNLTTLAPYYKLIPLPTGFEYNYVSDMAEGDTVKVKITVSTTGGESALTSPQKEVIITGFKTAALEALEEKAKLLVDQQTKITSQTATQAKAAINNDTSLTSYYQTIPLGNGFGYNYGGKSEVDKTDPTKLNVTLRVRNTSVQPNISIFKVVQITGFQAATPIEKEALNFQTSITAKTPSTLTMGVVSVINAIGDDQANKLMALKKYVDNFPEVPTGYTLSIGLAAPDTTTPTSVNIPITISPQASDPANRNAETTPVTVTFTITGLTVGSQDEQLEAISKLFNNRAVLSGKESETAAIAQKNLTGDNALNMYYQNTTMPTQFTYSYGGITEVNKQTNTILNVTLRIAFKTNGPVMFKVVQISGFTALTAFEAEAQKFAISAPATTSSTLTSAVITSINTTSTTQQLKLTALKGFATLPSDADSYTIVINTAKIDPTTPTSVIVPMTISKPEANGVAAPTPVSVNFIITGLTAPSASK